MCPLATAQSSERTLTHAGRSMRHPGLPASSSPVDMAMSARKYRAANFCDSRLSPSSNYLSCGPSGGIVNLLKGRTCINHVGDAALGASHHNACRHYPISNPLRARGPLEYEISVLSITRGCTKADLLSKPWGDTRRVRANTSLAGVSISSPQRALSIVAGLFLTEFPSLAPALTLRSLSAPFPPLPPQLDLAPGV
jgi:hypothetical protein